MSIIISSKTKTYYYYLLYNIASNMMISLFRNALCYFLRQHKRITSLNPK